MKEMDPRRTPDGGDGSLDAVELVMAIEEAVGSSLPDGEERDRLVLEIAERIAKGEFGDECFDDTLAIVVRKPRPRSSRGQARAAAVPEEPFFG
jgi:hypothetical protein